MAIGRGWGGEGPGELLGGGGGVGGGFLWGGGGGVAPSFGPNIPEVGRQAGTPGEKRQRQALPLQQIT